MVHPFKQGKSPDFKTKELAISVAVEGLGQSCDSKNFSALTEMSPSQISVWFLPGEAFPLEKQTLSFS